MEKNLLSVFFALSLFFLNPFGGFGQCSATVSISSSDTNICAGESVTFTATPTDGGSNPLYQWRVNGVNVGSNSSVNTYSTTTLQNAYTVNVVLTSDIVNCGAGNPVVSSNITTTVNPTPSVSVGVAISAICQGGTTTALGGSFGGGATSAVWSDGGAGGTFTNNSGTTPNTTTYTASASAPASVILTLTTAGGACGTISANKTLTINPIPTVSAGGAISAICQGGTTTALGGSFGGGATSAVWSDGGAGGTFTSNSGNTPYTTTYTASASAPASVILTLTTAGGGCGTISANKTITVNPNPTVSASGAVNAVCQGGTTTALGGSFGGGATSAVWSDGGAGGSFTNNSGTTPNTTTYIASATAPASVILTLTTAGGTCGSVNTTKTLTVNPNPSVNAGVAISAICQGGTTSALGGSFGGGATSAIWTANAAGGAFTNNTGNTPNTTTYTAAANAPASIILTLTTSGGPCGAVLSTKTLTVNPNPTVSAGGAVSAICQGGTTAALGGSFGGGASSAVWSDGGVGGTFTNNSGGTPSTTTYTASASAPASVILTLTTASGACGTISANKTLTVNSSLIPSVSIIASSNKICTSSPSGSTPVTFTATPTNGGASPSYQWKNGGTNVGTNSATYIANSLANGSQISVVMTSNATCASPSTATSNPITMTGYAPPTTPVFAASSGNVNITSGLCPEANGLVYTVTPNSNITSYVWVIPSGWNFVSGQGTNSITVNATVNTAINTNNIRVSAVNACGTSSQVTLAVDVNKSAGVNAGPDRSMCVGNPPITLNGSQTGYATNVLWSAPSGTFGSSGNTVTTYTPTITSGTVTLTLSSTKQPGNISCPLVSDQMILTVYPVPTAVAGTAVTACSNSTVNITAGSSATSNAGIIWTSNGTGTITNPTSLITATYTPGANETGPVTLTLTATGNPPCGNAVSTKSLTIKTAVTAVAGTAVTACSNSPVNITAGASATNNSGITWTSNGTGTIANPTSLTTATYTSGANETGPVTLTLTANGNAPCGNAVSTKTLTISAAATAVAGTTVTACSNSSVNITAGSSATNNSGITWTSNGTGIIANPTSLTIATYTPGANETGAITLTLTASGNTPCGNAVSTKTLTISAAATAVAGTAVATCSNSAAVNITGGSSASNNTGVIWTSNGTGTIANPTSLTAATYTPGANETGPVTLTLTATGNAPCGNAVSTKTLTISAASTSDAGTAVTTCSNSAAVNITGGSSATNNAGILWTSIGTGTIANPTSLTTATYTPGANETGTITITLTASGNAPCGNAVATKTLTISTAATADAGTEVTTCSNSGINITTGSSATNNAGIIWTSDGTGTIANPTSLTTATYTPGSGETGAITLTLTATGNAPCGNAVSTKILPINQEVSITTQPDQSQTVCSGFPVSFSVTATGTGLGYQWKKGGTNITGATSNLYSIPNVSTSDAATYTVEVSGTSPCTLVTSGNAVLEVFQDIDITSQPVSSEVCEGISTSFSVTATGTELSYQWRKGGIPVSDDGIISGATTNTLTFTGVSVNNAGSYDVVISSTGGTCSQTISNPAVLTVTPTVTIVPFSEATSTRCQGAESVTTITTATNSTGITYSLDAASLDGGNTIIATTGVVGYVAGWSGTTTITASAAGCNGPATTTTNVTITELPTASISYAGIPFCKDSGTQTVTFNGTTGGIYSAPDGLILDTSTGDITPSASDAGTYTVTYTIDVSGGCAPVKATTSVTITALPIATFNYNPSSFCKNGTNPTPIFTGGGVAGEFTSASGLSMTSTGQIDLANSTAGTYTVTNTIPASSGGCSQVTATASVTITALPTAIISYTGSPFCKSINTAQAVTLNETNVYTGGVFSAPGLSINATTGAITPNASTAGTHTVTYTIPASGGCAQVTATTSVTITVLPIATFNYTSSTFCKSGTNPTPVFTGGGVAGGFTSTSGLSINPTTGTIDLTASTAGAYTVTNTIAAIGGCTSVTATFNVTIDPLPVGGKLTFSGTSFNSYLICYDAIGSITRSIVLSEYTGTVVRWERSNDAGLNWSDVGHAGETTFSDFSNISSTTLIRAILTSGICGTTTSKIAVVNVIPDGIKPSPVQADKSIVCLGESVNLTSESGYASGSYITSGDFNNANPKGWIIDGNPGNNFPANGNNTKPNRWSETNDHAFDTRDGSKVFDSKDKKFAIVSGPNLSTLETPVFNTFGLSTASLTFDEAFIMGPNTTMKIELSVNGGTSYTVVLRDKPYGLSVDGVYRTNNYADFSGSNQRIDLSNYVGQANLKVRFTFDGRNDPQRSIWAIDGVTLPDKPINIAIIWTDEFGDTLGKTENITVVPDKPGVNIYNVRSYITLDDSGAPCYGSGQNISSVSVYAYDNYSSIAALGLNQNIVCGSNSVLLKGKIISAYENGEVTAFTVGDNSTVKWTVAGLSQAQSDPYFSDPKNPNAVFTAPYSPTPYVLNWTILVDPKSTCPAPSTPVQVLFKECTTLDFDGFDDYVDLGTGYNGDYSIEAWIRPFDRTKVDGTKTDASKGTIISTLKLEINMSDLSGLVSTNGRWYHIAVDSKGKLYVDGIDVGKDILKAGSSRSFIGARWNAPNPENHFSGWIEEVRIWNGQISQKNIQFTMNQRLKAAGNIGVEVDMAHPDAPAFGSLAGYYQLITTNILNGGYTPDLSGSPVNGKLRNMETLQENTAPLPYISANDGTWAIVSTWLRPLVWDAPNSNGVTGAPIDWNIVRINHNINSDDRDITVLGLKSETQNKLLEISGPGTKNEYNPGQMLRVTHYLLLDGNIDLVGESQLLQDSGSLLAESSKGWLERDQQGKLNSFVYNYWSSPVSLQGAGVNNAPYSVKSVLMDGTTSSNPQKITFDARYWIADFGRTSPITISTYWLWGYSPATANVYAEWDHILENGPLNTGEGFTMKGTDGTASINAEQNYTFRGKPHNGDFNLQVIPEGQNYLIGNPFPSALDGHEFIRNNLTVFDGALYFWDHFQKLNHILKEYIGGYAVLNLTSPVGVPAISNDDRINNDDPTLSSTKPPKQNIPVGQAFLINSTGASGGSIQFKNSQRTFKREAIPADNSIFLKPEILIKTIKEKTEDAMRIRISLKSPVGYHRQILVGAIPSTTNGFDLGYDALLFDDNVEDMYWLQGENQLVIQGVPNFNKDQVLPLGIKIKENKEFRIRIDTLENAPAEMKVYLNDKLKDSIHDLRAGPYISTSEPGYIHDRFEIIFFKEEPPVIEGPIVEEPEVEVPIIEDPQTDFTTLSIKHAHNLREIQIMNPAKLIITSVYLFDLNGNLIENYTNIPQNKEINLRVRNYSSGVYLLKVYAEGKIISKKIIISN